jgi:hypothetical protein
MDDIFVALPIIAVTALVGFLLSRIPRNNSSAAKRLIQDASCYALGFAMLCMALGGAPPLIFRGLLPSEVQLGIGLVATKPLPWWAVFSGVPFALYGLFSSGHILHSATSALPTPNPTVFVHIKWYAAGLAGLYISLIAVWLVAAANWPKLIGARHQLNKPDLDNITCRGDALELAVMEVSAGRSSSGIIQMKPYSYAALR